MRRLKKRNEKSEQKKALALFLVGVALGLIFFVFYRYTKPPTLGYRPKRLISRRETPPKPAAAVPLAPVPAAIAPSRTRVAVVLDDFGYNYKNVEAVSNLNIPVTFSILPNHPYSKTIAMRVHEKGYEAILHLPLEPHEKDGHIRPEAGVITTAMKKEDVLIRLKKALENVPYVKGVSNHQGSKATEDPELMRLIFMELKTRGMYFLDSLVTEKSVCRKVAREVGIEFGRRSIFLDNKDDFEYIKGQFEQLIRRARRSGEAIGIGHDREKTVLTLSKLMPEAKKEGVEFVFLSELIR